MNSSKDMEVPQKEAFELERIEYNKQNDAMQNMVADAIDMSATILKDTQKHREENEKLKR